MLQDQKPVVESKKYQVDYQENVASIKIHECSERDAASITCEAANELGSVKTTAQLEVQGTWRFKFDFLIRIFF